MKTNIALLIADNEQTRRKALQSNAIVMHYNSDGTATVTFPVIERSIIISGYTASVYYTRLVRNGLFSYRITY